MRSLALMVLLAVVAACTPSPSAVPTQNQPSLSPEVASPSPIPSFVTFGDGKHRVGADVPAGTYRVLWTAPIAGEDFCYWERVSGLGGSEADLSANSGGKGSRVVTIAPTDAGFTSSGCGTWSSNLASPGVPIGDGVWVVGVDLQPGRYRSDGGSTCLWQRLSGFGGTDAESLEVGERSSTDILPTDAGFMSLNCGRWSPA